MSNTMNELINYTADLVEVKFLEEGFIFNVDEDFLIDYYSNINLGYKSSNPIEEYIEKYFTHGRINMRTFLSIITVNEFLTLCKYDITIMNVKMINIDFSNSELLIDGYTFYTYLIMLLWKHNNNETDDASSLLVRLYIMYIKVCLDACGEVSFIIQDDSEDESISSDNEIVTIKDRPIKAIENFARDLAFYQCSLLNLQDRSLNTIENVFKSFLNSVLSGTKHPYDSKIIQNLGLSGKVYYVSDINTLRVYYDAEIEQIELNKFVLGEICVQVDDKEYNSVNNPYENIDYNQTLLTIQNIGEYKGYDFNLFKQLDINRFDLEPQYVIFGCKNGSLFKMPIGIVFKNYLAKNENNSLLYIPAVGDFVNELDMRGLKVNGNSIDKVKFSKEKIKRDKDIYALNLPKYTKTLKKLSVFTIDMSSSDSLRLKNIVSSINIFGQELKGCYIPYFIYEYESSIMEGYEIMGYFKN